MFAQDYRPDDDVCPVDDELLAQLYNTSKAALPSIIATVSPRVRAMLALFCYHRSHLHALGLVIAASCEEDELVREGGRVGATLFSRSREALRSEPPPAQASRRKITLASGQLRSMPPLVDEPDDGDTA